MRMRSVSFHLTPRLCVRVRAHVQDGKRELGLASEQSIQEQGCGDS